MDGGGGTTDGRLFSGISGSLLSIECIFIGPMNLAPEEWVADVLTVRATE